MGYVYLLVILDLFVHVLIRGFVISIRNFAVSRGQKSQRRGKQLSPHQGATL